MRDHILVAQHKKTKLWHALLFRNHPTPSGCDRPILKLSTKTGKESPKEAVDEMKNNLEPEYWKKIDLPDLNDIENIR